MTDFRVGQFEITDTNDAIHGVREFARRVAGGDAKVLITVVPCRVVYKDSSDVSNLPQEVMSLWNNDHDLWARSLFSARVAPRLQQTICDGCEIFAKHPSKEAIGDIPA